LASQAEYPGDDQVCTHDEREDARPDDDDQAEDDPQDAHEALG